MASCIYCGNRANSQEHVYPAWMIEALSRDTRGLRLPTRAQVRKDGVLIRQMMGKVTPRKTVEFTTKVCAECNNGWMNRVGERARPFVEKMMAGLPTELTTEAQAAVDTFMTMTTITRYSAEHRAYVNHEWTRRLRETEAPLPDWMVWVGRYEGVEPLYANLHDVSVVAKDGTTILDHGVFSTLVAGYLVVQVFHVADGRIVDHPEVPLILVGPPRSDAVKWPPRNAFTDETLALLADRFIGTLARFETTAR